MNEDGGQAGQVRLQLTVASVALAIGVLVYLADRAASRSILMPNFGAHASLHAFGAVGLWLPSFVHSFAFSLFTAAALHPQVRPAFAACVAWGALNVLFEIGQHPRVSVHLADGLRRCEGWLPSAQSLSNYFVRGTFDPGDIVAAVLGAMAAAAVLHLTHRRVKVHHAP